MRSVVLCVGLILGMLPTTLFGQSQPASAPPTPVQAGGLLQLPAANDPGSQKSALLLEQMIKALGGQAYLSMQDSEQVGRTFSFYHGESQGAGALFRRLWKWPDKERFEIAQQQHGWGFIGSLPLPPSSAQWIVIYTGDKAFELTDRGTAALEAATLEDYLRRRQHSLPWVLRKWLKEPGVALLYEGPGVAERKQVDKVTILSAKNEAVTISIDSNTHLPLRVAFTWREPRYRDRVEEAEGYDNYRLVQGIMTPFSITRYKDGEPTNQRFVTEARYNQNPVDSVFDPNAAPVGSKQSKKK